MWLDGATEEMHVVMQVHGTGQCHDGGAAFGLLLMLLHNSTLLGRWAGVEQSMSVHVLLCRCKCHTPAIVNMHHGFQRQGDG